MIVSPTDLNQQIMISVYLRRDNHENGMTLKEYADLVIAGTQPILDHNAFVYQFGSLKEEIELVENWASAAGLSIIESNQGTSTVKVQGTADQFNKLFNIRLQTIADETRTYHTYEGSMTIPNGINEVVENVEGLDNSKIFKRNFVTYDPLTNPNLLTLVPVTPVQVATAYKIPPGDGSGGCIGIFELTGNGYTAGYNQSDITNSFSRIGLPAPLVVPYPVSGATISSTSDSESMLDIYCAGAVVPNAKMVYYVSPRTAQGVIDCINAAANDVVNNPSALSISWAIGDYTYYNSAIQSCVVKGITVLIATGDAGAQNLSMTSPYPIATNPYAIMTGGTTIQLDSNNQIVSETAWSGSGGGISNGVFARPSWQDGLTYTTKTASSVGTPTALPYRGVPDMSAPGDPNTGYQFYLNGTLTQAGGCSAAAPFLAGMLVRLNQLLGFRIGNANSTWYANATSLFRDIIVGDNRDGYTTGYTATTGWDPVTGLGSPIGQLIYNLFANNGIKVKTASSTWTPVQNISIKTAANTWSTVNRVWTKTASGWLQTY
jgi:kumamolisin